MNRSRTGFGSIVGLLLACVFAIAVLVAGLWFSKQREAQVLRPVAVAVAEREDAAPGIGNAPSLEAGSVSVPEQGVAGDPSPKEAPVGGSLDGDAQATAPAQTPEEAEATSAADPAAATEGAEAGQNAAATKPTFDEVRREGDGLTVIAGRAAPGAEVRILSNGEVVARTSADASGKFATIAIVPTTDEGHLLALDQHIGDEVTRSDEEIILAPGGASRRADAGAETTQIASADQTTGEPTTAAEPLSAGSEASTTIEERAAATETTPQETIADAPEVQASRQAEALPSEPNGASADTPAPPQEPQEAASEAPVIAARRQPAPQPAAPVLKSTAAGIEVLKPSAPEVMSNVELDVISYSETGDVQLSGRAQQQGNRVRVYLDNRAITDLGVDAQGRWRGDLPDVDEGIYTLRVDEVAANGSVISRVETPFKRESVAALAAASTAEGDGRGAVSAVTVQKGDTLWAISRERYGDGLLYVRVFEANADAIRDPDLIYPGQVFDLPE